MAASVILKGVFWCPCRTCILSRRNAHFSKVPLWTCSEKSLVVRAYRPLRGQYFFTISAFNKADLQREESYSERKWTCSKKILVVKKVDW